MPFVDTQRQITISWTPDRIYFVALRFFCSLEFLNLGRHSFHPPCFHYDFSYCRLQVCKSFWSYFWNDNTIASFVPSISSIHAILCTSNPFASSSISLVIVTCVYVIYYMNIYEYRHMFLNISCSCNLNWMHIFKVFFSNVPWVFNGGLGYRCIQWNWAPQLCIFTDCGFL